MLLDPNLPAVDEIDGHSLNMPAMPVLDARETPFQTNEPKLLQLAPPGMHQRRRSTYVNRMNAIRYPERVSENLSRKISSAMIIPEDEEEELELGPELVSDEEIFRNLDERLI
jgi:hypothetical protein